MRKSMITAVVTIGVSTMGVGAVATSVAFAAPINGAAINDTASTSLTQRVWWDHHHRWHHWRHWHHRHCWWRHGYRHCW